MLYDRFSFNRLLFVYLTSSYSSSSSRSFRSIRRALIIRIYENHDEGRSWPKVSSCIIQFIVGERGKKEVKKEKKEASRRMESEKICAAKEISRTNRGGAMRILFLPLRLIALSFSPFFSQAHVHPATHADTWRRHTKKIAYNCTIFLSIAIFLPSRPLFSRTVHGALPITTYIVFSNNGKILRPHRHFHPLCHLIGAFFKGKTKLPARLLMVASGKRSSSFDPWSSVLFPPMDPAFDYSIFFFFPPLDTQFTDIVYYSSISRNVDSF